MAKCYTRNFFLFCAVSAGLLHGAYRQWGQPDRRNPEVAYVIDHRNEFNVLFFGSSISEGNIDPRTFDRLMAREGYHSSSFTLGMGSADMHQIDWAIRAVLRSKPRNLKYVFVELRDFETDIPDRNQYTDSAIRWHDPQQTRSVLRSIQLSDRSPLISSREQRLHLNHFLLKYVPLGIVYAQGLRDSEAHFDPKLRGYVAYDVSFEHRARQQARFQRNLSWYFSLVEERRRGDARPIDIRKFNLEALRSQAALIRRAGATPIYWTGPSLNDYSFAVTLAEAGQMSDALFFHDAARFPQLFDPTLRLDFGHLNHEGTQVFMPMLIDAFLASRDGEIDLPPGSESSLASLPLQ